MLKIISLVDQLYRQPFFRESNVKKTHARCSSSKAKKALSSRIAKILSKSVQTNPLAIKAQEALVFIEGVPNAAAALFSRNSADKNCDAIVLKKLQQRYFSKPCFRDFRFLRKLHVKTGFISCPLQGGKIFARNYKIKWIGCLIDYIQNK